MKIQTALAQIKYVVRYALWRTRPTSQTDQEALQWLSSSSAGANHAYQKFIILTAPRSGSNWLVSLLHSSNQICAYGEIFNYRRVLTGAPYKDGIRSKKIIGLRNLAPLSFVTRYIFRGYEHRLKAVGFKVMYHDLERPLMGPVASFLASSPEIKIVHLIRKDLLRSLVSERIARLSDTWAQKTSDSVIYLSEDECRAHFEKIEGYIQEYAKRFSKSQVLEVHYENLVQEPNAECARILQFLGVEQSSLNSSLRKQEMRPLDDIVANYSDLKDRFQSSKYREYFDA